ncbi:ABC transporter permease [Betaproteobacteria bacterium]|nr:ABC transporter permease [Betaproteobacteria bacterium]GHU20167.1 ABC transporter permease [Betaproteobacteria bacterium]
MKKQRKTDTFPEPPPMPQAIALDDAERIVAPTETPAPRRESANVPPDIHLVTTSAKAPPTRSSVWGPRLLRTLERASLFIAILIAWFVAAEKLPLGDNPLIPSPVLTFRALVESLPELWRGTISSFFILIPGFGAASVAGIVWGLIVGTSPRLQRIFFPFSRVAAPIPPTVYIPYAIAILPTFRLSAIFVVFIGAFWPVFHNTAAGAVALEQRYRDNASILGLTGAEYLWRVVFPASLPHIFSGMGVGLAFSFVMLTVAEMFGANHGLGRFVQFYADYAEYPKMVAGILYTGLITWLSMTLLDLARHRALFWLR